MALDTVLKIASEALSLTQSLGAEGRVNVETPDEKRACLLEQEIWKSAKGIVDGRKYHLMTEGFPDHGNPKSKTKFYVDPIDGTVYYARQRSKSPFPVTTVISEIKGNKYSDAVAAAVADINTGEIWYASKSKETTSSSYGKCQTGGNEEHDPLYLSDFFFVQNANMRSKLRNPVNPEWDAFEFLNPGSVAVQGAKVACGEADCMINIVGPKGFELTAMYLLVKQAGGYSIDYNTGEELGSTRVEFNARQPVIMAKDEVTARDVYEKIKSE